MNEHLQTRKPRVAVVFGGRSSEHAHLVRDGRQRARGDRPGRVRRGAGRHHHDGRWVLESGDPERLAITGGRRAARGRRRPRRGRAAARARRAPSSSSPSPASVPRTLGEVDVVFPLLHGPWGEDGTIQGLLEMAGVRYVGAGVLASAVGMDKHYMKVVLAAARPPGAAVRRRSRRAAGRPTAQACREAVDALGYPVFVKPARGGSSLGISKVHDADELDDGGRGGPPPRPEGARRGRPPRAAREVECGVLQGLGRRPPGRQRRRRDPDRRRARVLRLRGEVPPRGAHRARRPGRPARPTSPTRIRELAARAFEALGCEGLARVDFFVHARRAAW